MNSQKTGQFSQLYIKGYEKHSTFYNNCVSTHLAKTFGGGGGLPYQ